MKCRFRLSNTCLVALSLCGLWATSAHAQETQEKPPDKPVDETSSTIGQDDLNPAQMPPLDANEPIICVENDAGETLRIQCDDALERCLVAKPHLEIPGARDKVVARMMRPCEPAEPGALARLERAGYEMVPALLETRHGYKRDERGRIYQTHFDLRRRFLIGVYDAMTITSGASGVDHRLSAEIGGVYEEYDEATRRRDRHQIAHGQITLDPVEVEGLLYGYDRGRSGDEPVFRFVEFVTPEPDRYDISIHLGPGARLGRFSYEEIDGRGLALIDALHGHINWEIAQNDEQGLEDYLLIRGGVGGGFLDMDGLEDNPGYLYPEVGVEGAWLIDDRGLTQLRGEASYRHIWDDAGDERERASAELSLERVVLSINDQPITAFAQGGVEYKSGPLAEDGLTSFEALIGGRMSFFVPPPPNYESE